MRLLIRILQIQKLNDRCCIMPYLIRTTTIFCDYFRKKKKKNTKTILNKSSATTIKSLQYLFEL